MFIKCAHLSNSEQEIWILYTLTYQDKSNLPVGIHKHFLQSSGSTTITVTGNMVFWSFLRKRISTQCQMDTCQDKMNVHTFIKECCPSSLTTSVGRTNSMCLRYDSSSKCVKHHMEEVNTCCKVSPSNIACV